MTPEAAIYQWMNGFGLPAYAATSTPDEGDDEWAGYPYLTYELVLGEWNEGEVNMPVNLWDRTDSEARLNAVVRRIGESVPPQTKVPVQCDGGILLISRGSPWAQAVRVEGEDEKVKRRYININIETAVAW